LAAERHKLGLNPALITVRVTIGAVNDAALKGRQKLLIPRPVMHMNRFVVFQLEDEWLVTFGDRKQGSFPTREEAEHSAFLAADAMASSGYAVSVLIMPNGLEATAQHQVVRYGHTYPRSHHSVTPRLQA
jgi:hypothetical protein